MTKPIIVGESNPYGSDPHYALYPAPDGCSGHRLCCLILGMSRAKYLDAFHRANLCDGKWSIGDARKEAMAIKGSGHSRIILLGSKVSAAFGVAFSPFTIVEAGTLLILPHPSGLCRLWNEEGAIQRGRDAVAYFMPELKPLIGENENG